MATPATIIDLNLPTIALVGRVNVGKSTLFNRITESNKALTSAIAGTTRTRNVSVADWRGKQFLLIDTGGLTFTDDVILEKEILEQTETGLDEADAIALVVDLKNGLLPQEKELALLLRRRYRSKKVLLVGNKADSPKDRAMAHEREWQSLGLGEPLPVSALNGSGVGDLLDEFFRHFQSLSRRPKKSVDRKPIRVALIGKPNVGKSSLFNKLIGQERVIVSPMPHTTREPHDTLVDYQGQPIVFVDTAGIRRKTKVAGELERGGIGKSLAAIQHSDIVLLVLDTTEPITDQDQQLGGLLREHTKSVIIVINKWDLAEGNDDHFRNEVKADIYAAFPHLNFAPIVFVSAKTSYRTQQIFPLILRAEQERHIEIPPETLEICLKEMIKKRLPTRGKGVHHPKILSLKQVAHNPPIFELAVKANTSVHSSYAHYIANRLREQFSFFAAPIIIRLHKRKKQ